MSGCWSETLCRGRWVAFMGLAILMGSGGGPLFGRQPVTDAVWQPVSVAARSAAVSAGIAGGGATVVQFNKAAFDAFVTAAPEEISMRSGAPLVFSLPMPDGTLSRFTIAESPIISPELSAAYPEIRTFTGQGVDDPTATTRFGWTSAGFHAIVVAASGTTYIDPLTPGILDLYLVAAKASRPQPQNPFVCLLNGTGEEVGLRTAGTFPITNGDSLRTYRMALAATAEYTAVSGGVSSAVNRMVATMNRVNGIFERELAVRMTVATGTTSNPTALIYTDSASDPYTNSDGGAMINQNQAAIDTVIGTAGYDIGHVFSTFEGGVAVQGSPCNVTFKAKGVTGSASPVGDVFDVDYVAHEIGHQFNAHHSFNSTSSSCVGANRSSTHAYEVGSGSTIMGYAGICAPENLQPTSNDNFHFESLNEMTAFITSGGGAACGVVSATGNVLPTVSTSAAFTIPARTPFTLTASGADANGDALTYAWEEFDLGAASNSAISASTDDGSRPLFRSYPPSSSSSRTFPSLTYILNNNNTPPTTYPCSIGTCLTGEVLPSTSRTMNFHVTARDNRAGGGGINTAGTTITVSSTAGPFQVTTPDTALSLTGGAAQTITWNEAGTSVAPVSAANVRILLSTDGGASFGTELLASTPNDGSQIVTLPNLTTTAARIKVEAVGNVFFDVSNANFSITADNTNAVPGPPTGVSGVAGNGQVSVSFSAPATNGGSAITSYTVTASPGGATATGAGSPLVVTGLNNGTPYTFTVTATNAFGTSVPSAPSPAVVPTSGIPASVAVAPGALVFGATKNGAGGPIVAVTAPQLVIVTFAGSTPQWTATANQPWVQISNGAGTGTGLFSVGISDPPNAIGGASSVTATITISAPSAGLTTTIGLTLRLIPNGTSALSFGQVDTPIQNANGVQGAIGVTGWALDDVGVASVQIYRNCLPVDAGACQSFSGHSVVYIGDAAFVPGARADLEAGFPTVPQAYRGGWGYLMLTNMLPNVTSNLPYGGQGPLTLYAFATDMEGRRTMLGRAWSGAGSSTPTSITMANNTIAKPFGAIDTPGQGEMVSGIIPNFGWALTPDLNTAADGSDIVIPVNGSTMSVVIDGAAVGTVAYDQCRVGANPVTPGTYCLDDVANIFGNPTPQAAGTPRSANNTLFRNLDAGRAAIGAFDIDTRLMTNGRHSIAWGVTDSAGRPEGIGSRDFIVFNGSARIPNQTMTAAQFADAAVVNLGSTEEIAGRTIAASEVWGRTGFDFSRGLEVVAPDEAGMRHITIPEVGRLELWLGDNVTAGYLQANGQLRPLPPGSQLDTASGRFTWGPLVGYMGPYDLVFLSGDTRLPIRVTLQPKTSEAAGLMRGNIDAPATRATLGGRFAVAGWALDVGAWQGSGVGAVHVWAQRDDSYAPAQFLGAAEIGVARPDVAGAFGSQFDRTGWSLTASGLAPGRYTVTAYFWSNRTERFEDARSITVTVR